MPAPKGHDGQGGGRPKGSPNKTTVNARAAIADFVEGNVDRLTGWLDSIAEDDPKAAFDSFMSVVEYHIPKLLRSENKNENTENININVNIQQKILEMMTVEQLEKVEQLAIASATLDAGRHSGSETTEDAKQDSECVS